jgi:hypothetical protein
MDYVLYMVPIIGAIGYSVAAYFRDTPLEVFNPTKFLSTVLVGAVIGIISVQTASPLTEQWVGVQLIAYAGMTSVIENAIKAIWRRINPQSAP